jgi:hypothetical protein
MATTLHSLEAVLEAPAAIHAATALTIWSIKVRSENGFDATVGATGGGTLSPPCLSDASSNDTYAWRDSISSRSPIDLPLSECTDVVGISEEVPAKGSQSRSLL